MHTRQAMSTPVFMVLTMIAATRAYRAYQERLEADPDEKEPAADPLGFRRLRRQVLSENADKVMVFVGDMFAILPLVDYSMLIGTTMVCIRGAPPPSTVSRRRRAPNRVRWTLSHAQSTFPTQAHTRCGLQRILMCCLRRSSRMGDAHSRARRHDPRISRCALMSGF